MNYQWSFFLASLDPTTGSEQAGKRPVIVISREQINQRLPVVNVIPLTSRKSPSRAIYPTASSRMIEPFERPAPGTLWVWVPEGDSPEMLAQYLCSLL